MSPVMEWLIAEKAKCTHEVKRVDRTHNTVITLRFEPEICPHCLRNEIAMFKEIVSRALTLGIDHSMDDDNDELRDQLMEDIDTMMKSPRVDVTA